MPSIRDVVRALGERDGVEAVVLLGEDGLTIDSSTTNDLDPEGLSALVPPVIRSCNSFGAAAGRGGFGTLVVEFGSGLAIIAELTAETLLAIVVRPNTNVGRLLYELRRHRAAIAELL